MRRLMTPALGYTEMLKSSYENGHNKLHLTCIVSIVRLASTLLVVISTQDLNLMTGELISSSHFV